LIATLGSGALTPPWMVRLSLFNGSALVAAVAAGAVGTGAGFTGDDLGGGAFGAGSAAFAVGFAPVVGRTIEGDGRAGNGRLIPPGSEVVEAMGARGGGAGGAGGSGSSTGAGAGVAMGGTAVAALASLSASVFAGGASLPGSASPMPATLDT